MLKQGTGEGFFQKLMVLYVIVWSISPPLEIDMVYRLLALGCVGIWALAAMKRGLYVERVHVYAAFFAVMVVVITYFQTESINGILQQIAIYILVVCFWINCFYRNRWDELSGIISIVLILLIVFNWKTGTVLLEDPTIARRLVRADESVYGYLRQGVGGYSLIYPQVCIFPAFLAWTLRALKHNKKCFALGLIWLFSYIRCISNAGYSIAIFTSIVGAVILLAFKGRRVWTSIVLAVLIFVVGLWMIINVDSFREMLLNTFDGTAVAMKINDLVASSQEGAAEGSIYVRIEAYKGSLNTILNYPVIGSLWMASGSGHSALLDMFAKYGIWGGSIYAYMLFHVPVRYKGKLPVRKVYSISNAVIVSILFVVVLDSFTYSFMPMILLVLPLLYEDIIKWEKLRDESVMDR